ALRAIEERRPRLVVLDLMLPGLDGLSVIRRARAIGETPILVLSARGSTGDRILGLSEGADDYLPKPFSPAELVVPVRTILRRTGRRRGGDRGPDGRRDAVRRGCVHGADGRRRRVGRGSGRDVPVERDRDRRGGSRRRSGRGPRARHLPRPANRPPDRAPRGR